MPNNMTTTNNWCTVDSSLSQTLVDVEKIRIVHDFEPSFIDMLNNKTGISIFEYASFQSQIGKTAVTRIIAPILQVMVCISLQVFGLYFIAYKVAEERDREYGGCAWDEWEDVDHICKKITSLLLCIVLSYQVFDIMDGLRSGGLYFFVTLSATVLPNCISRGWAHFGYYWQTVIISISVTASYSVIYASETAQDIIFNAIAIQFIIQIPYLMVNFKYYRNLKRALVRPKFYCLQNGHIKWTIDAGYNPIMFAICISLKWVTNIIAIIAPLVVFICY